MNDEELQLRVRQAYLSSTRNSTDAEPPDFDTLWQRAEDRAQQRSRWPAVAAGLAVLAAAGLFGINLSNDNAEHNDAWVAGINESLLNTAAWSAPSDVLLQHDAPDVYESLPTLFESTELEFETLL